MFVYRPISRLRVRIRKRVRGKKRGRNLDTNRWKVQRKEGKGRCARALQDGNRADLSAPGNFRKADVLLSISSSAESFLYNYARACTVFRCSPEADAIFHFTKWITRLGDEAFPVDTDANAPCQFARITSILEHREHRTSKKRDALFV